VNYIYNTAKTQKLKIKEKHVIYIHPELQQYRCGYRMKVAVPTLNTHCYCTKTCRILVEKPEMRTKLQR
jgi:hypothetical protein